MKMKITKEDLIEKADKEYQEIREYEIEREWEEFCNKNRTKEEIEKQEEFKKKLETALRKK